MLDTIKIEKERSKLAISQEQIAEMLDMSRTGYSLLIKSGDFKATKIVKIAEILNVSIAYLFGETENKEVPKVNKIHHYFTHFEVGTGEASKTACGKKTDKLPNLIGSNDVAWVSCKECLAALKGLATYNVK